ncbi:glycosyltransferase family 4 protein [Rhizohabitans arisaemae]|uniref:glycosyltransferase family 4 protein n=1 Tax=Rhizohabitans arisaemae TaxID=2720610 RepID=UPI0024B0D72D|nr:glycosyltransferase family 4 protein [Rhizohabitans arisaemae]
MINKLVRRALDLRARRYRRPPALKTGRGGGTTVYYLCPDYPVPSGGIRMIYRHVDLLNEAGVDAAVLHHRTGFSCRWFDHSTRVVGAPSVTLSESDVLVVPEIYGPSLGLLPQAPRMVVFNQNAYLTFDGLDEGAAPPYRGLPNLEAVLTVSEDSAKYLRFAFPELPVTVVVNGIDTEVFHPSGQPPPKRIAYMPRKRPDDAAQVLGLLRAHGSLEGWELVPIAGSSESETARILRSSPIFFAFGKQEGFGLPPAEAMVSGCCVVGFTGFAGKEFFLAEFSVAVEDGDVLAFATAAASVLEQYEKEPDSIRKAGRDAAEHIRRTYPVSRQRAELLNFYGSLDITPGLGRTP